MDSTKENHRQFAEEIHRAFSAELDTFSPKECDVQYEPVDHLIRLSNKYVIRRSEFHATDDGAMIDGDCTGSPLESNVSRVTDPDGVNIYSDYHLLRAIWFLKYATVKQCEQVACAMKKNAPQIYLSETVSYEYTRKRLSLLAKQGLLNLYKVEHKHRGVIRVYSLTEDGTDFISSVSGIDYKVYKYPSVAIPEILLGRVSENEIIRRICTSSKNFIGFDPPEMKHRSDDLAVITGGKYILDVDYNIRLSNPKSSKKETHLMVQYIRDPNEGKEIFTQNDCIRYYKKQALLSKEYIIENAGKDNSRGDAKVLFVCETNDAIKTILSYLQEVQYGRYFWNYYRNYIFTSEKAVILKTEYDGKPFEDALTGINLDINEKTNKAIKQFVAAPPIF